MKKVSIRRSGIDGKGLIANERIAKGEDILPLKGRVVHRNIGSKEDSRGTEHWITCNKKNTWVDPGNNEFRYLNHSCDPNATIGDDLMMRAIRSIDKGDEITIDYGLNEVDDHFWAMKCKCGKKNCRGIIRSVIHVPPTVFFSHFPHISEYSQRIYLKHHVLNSKQAKARLQRNGLTSK